MADVDHGRWLVVRMVRFDMPPLGSLPRRYAAPVVVGLLLLAWAIVYVAGGTRTAFPHVFYLPIVVAVVPFGRRGGIVTAIAATLLCGPVMPLDAAVGLAQAPANWLTRGLFFMVVGVAAGTAVRYVGSEFEMELARHFRDELTSVATPTVNHAATAGRIRDVIDNQLFITVFQPIYNLDTGEVVALEALTRFADTLPPQPPDVWFDQAEQVGLGTDLELATARAALHAVRDLPRHVGVAINASPAALADQRMQKVLDRRVGRPLIVELTEHTIVDDYTHTSTGSDRAPWCILKWLASTNR